MTVLKIINAPKLYESDFRYYVLVVYVMYDANENHMFNYYIIITHVLSFNETCISFINHMQ